MQDEYDIPKIETFKELLHEFCWSYDPKYGIIKHKDEGYSVNKLYIGPDEVKYKTDVWILSPGVYEQFEKFVEFLESTEEGDNNVYDL